MFYQKNPAVLWGRGVEVDIGAEGVCYKMDTIPVVFLDGDKE